MTPEQWQQVRGVLDEALELKPEDRPAFLDRACASDHALRREVERLLSSDNEVRSSFLQSAEFRIGVAPGAKLGDYEVQTLIGSGGMGEVYRAHDPRLGRDVAIKVLPTFLSHDADRLRRFEQEARAAAALNHPNILAVFQMGTYEGAPYLVSELLEGSTLRGQLGRGPLPARKATEYGVQIARGLAVAHEKGIAHRDLKPENLFITKDGRVKILDFGLAKLIQPRTTFPSSAPTVSEGTEPGVVMGTVGYMAPEQVRGEPADYHADIFAFGAILYEMLTGKRAFRKPTSAETMSAILNEDPPGISQIVPGILPTLERVVQRCLEKSPKQRFQSASDLAFAMEALSDSRVQPPRPSVAPQKYRLKLGWIVGVSIVLVASVLSIFWRQAGTEPQVEGFVQLTHDGQPKPPGKMASDGSRIYFQEWRSGSLEIAQTSIAGGETVPLTAGLVNPEVLDITPDFSSLLIKHGGEGNTFIAMLPLPAGQPRDIVKADIAALFPDGERLVYCAANSIYIAQVDGSNARKLLEVNGIPLSVAVSPDGGRLRLNILDPSAGKASLWELRSDEAQPRLQRLPVDENAQSGSWMPDGRFFIFAMWKGHRDLWALPEKRGLFSRSPKEPVRLTNGPLNYFSSLPGRDGRRIFVVGQQNRGELIRYDSASKRFLPALDGISVTDVTYSQDGRWMAYLSYPDDTVWRSRPDGSDRLQLTYNPPIAAFYPRISPDGKQVAFVGKSEQGLLGYIVDMVGGKPRRVPSSSWLPLAWSPDSKSLVFNILPEGTKADLETMRLAILNLESGKLSAVPSSQSKIDAHWPSPQVIVANGEKDKLYSFDVQTEKWSALADGPISNSMVSPDAKYLYFIREIPGNPQAMRVRLADHKIETVASLRGLRRVSDSSLGGATWMGVSTDGSLLLARDIGTQEIYALNIKWP